MDESESLQYQYFDIPRTFVMSWTNAEGDCLIEPIKTLGTSADMFNRLKEMPQTSQTSEPSRYTVVVGFPCEQHFKLRKQ
ncbi:hypothetical protein FPOAC1_002331 [Fusarium poae]|uniref:hypothetical protein n=1 Tax=Fusarium poae TaxID=36050 RepID=UPI001CE8014E|nr:hypothetical protein FPOAC1_002331 [Fusarium poae]KAG8676328.1 hypothetical protein FPOAC1_002331 [Fusarium poae]